MEKLEILLLTGTSFAQKELAWANNDETNRLQPGIVELLEEACWNGQLDELLTDSIPCRENGRKLFLWKINVAEAFLCIQLSTDPSPVSRFYSLDPYMFLPLKKYN